MATVFTVMSYGGLALAVVCLVLAAVLFIKWNIPKVFGDITGRTQKKTIERIRREGYEANASKRTAIKATGDTGRITIRKSQTDPLAKKQAAADEEQTTVLDSGAATGEEQTTVLDSGAVADEEQTTVLDRDVPDEPKTTVLTGREPEGVIQLPDERYTQPGTVIRILDLMVTHTDEEVPDMLERNGGK